MTICVISFIVIKALKKLRKTLHLSKPKKQFVIVVRHSVIDNE